MSVEGMGSPILLLKSAPMGLTVATGEVDHNYTKRKTSMTEMAGISVFYKDAAGEIFHTYSCYSRGLDMMNAAYHYLDLVPKGRDEAGLS